MPSSRTPCTPENMTKFLNFLSENGNISESARSCNLSRRTLYACRELDPTFAAAWDEALELGLNAIEDEAIRRAAQGVEEPVFYAGLPCGTVRKYSDLLMIFLFKSRRPTRYGGATAQPTQPPLITLSNPAQAPEINESWSPPTHLPHPHLAQPAHLKKKTRA